MAAYAAPAQKSAPRVPTEFQSAVAITPADATAIGPYAALYIGVAGDVKVCLRNDDGTHLVIFKSCPVGILPVAVQGVEATGTAATNILGLG